MSVQKTRIYKKIARGYDIVHFETDSECVIMSNNQNVEQAMADKANKNHTHSQYASSSHNHDSTYAKLNHSHSQYATIEWVTNNFALKGSSTDRPTPTPTPDPGPSTTIPTTVGATFQFAGHYWILVHLEGERVYCMMQNIYSKVKWINGYNKDGFNASPLHDAIVSFENSISSYLSNAFSVTSGGGSFTSKVFLATWRQVGGWYSSGAGTQGGSFQYFSNGSDASRRSATYNGTETAWWVDSGNTFDSYNSSLNYEALQLMTRNGPAYGTDGYTQTFTYPRPTDGDPEDYDNYYYPEMGLRPCICLKR